MDFNLVTNLRNCSEIVEQMTHGNINMLYYSHIPTIAISLLLGFFVYFKNRDNLSARILMLISVSFSIWAFLDLIAWVSPNSLTIMFSWALMGIFDALIYMLSVYFTYTFLDGKDISFFKKALLCAIVLPIIVMTPTNLNLAGFNFDNCAADENDFLRYSYVPSVVAIAWIVVLSVIRFIQAADRSRKKQIFLLATGMLSFLTIFLLVGFLFDITGDYYIEVFGLFGVVVFMGFLAYLIVKFKAFNIKLLGAQALVAGLLIGIGSQFFFIQNPTNRVLNAVTFCLALGFGYFLVRSVKLEVQRKEELENLSGQLSAANDKLHQLDKAKSEFISIASHQLRTPLTSIKGFTSLLLEGTYGPLPQTQKTALEKVYISNERLIQLVEDLLNISRMDAGRMEFDFQIAQIEDLVKEAVDTLELSAKAKNLYLDWQKPEALSPKLKIDITKIKEVISNMIDNAIKYTQKGGITVHIEHGAWNMEQKSAVRVVVSDTGIGMDRDELGLIFHKFQRGREVSHYHTDGTGLGMYIGKKVIEAHKGRIFAESDGKGKGSRFILELPID